MLADKLSNYFDSGVRQQGQAYFEARRVKIVSMQSNGDVDAQVTGSQRYDVRIGLDRTGKTWTVGATCSCPYMGGGNGLCKHVWATLLALETAGTTGRSPAPFEWSGWMAPTIRCSRTRMRTTSLLRRSLFCLATECANSSAALERGSPRRKTPPQPGPSC